MNKLLLLLFGILCSSCSNKSIKEPKFSFYYKDTLDLGSVYLDYDSVWCNNPKIYIKDKQLVYLKNIYDFEVEDLKNKILFKKDSKIYSDSLFLRCWKDDVFQLKEVGNTFLNNKIIMRMRRFFYSHFKDTLEYRKEFFHQLLLTYEDNSYFVEKGMLFKITKEGKKINLSPFILEDPINNQLIINGQFGALRTGHSIFFSSDTLKSWKKIYYGPRGIKQTMVWDNIDTTLIFSQYTPGSIRVRHHILKYDNKKDKIDTLKVFYTEKEYLEKGLAPCCRHIHILTKDPYTGWLFLGTGDSDIESAIYCSKDNGNNFIKVGGDKQFWRTLSFQFTPKSVFWTTDSHTPQYFTRISKDDIGQYHLLEKHIKRFPIFNSALWNCDKYKNLYIMSSSCEGKLYDSKFRIFGVNINEKEEPDVYNLYEEQGEYWSNQLFLLGIDNQGIFYFYDNKEKYYRTFVFEKK